MRVKTFGRFVSFINIVLFTTMYNEKEEDKFDDY